MLNGNQLNAVEVIHGVVDGQPWERIIHLTGAPAEILRRGERVSCLHRESSKHFHASSSRLQALLKHQDFTVPVNYILRKGGDGRVAGREAYRVDVLPKDKARYGYQFWLDKASGLLLKSVTVDRKGRGLEVFEFVSIDIRDAIDPAVFNPGEGLHWADKPQTELEAPVPQLNWKLSWLPTGFDLSGSEMRVVDGVAASTKVFTDGLAAFSVFLEKIDSRIHTEGTQTHGATTALSRRLPVKNGEYLVTVVGEIPMETAMQVAMAVRLAGDVR
ncbi:MAG: hypothetical protein CSA49_05625 [Gammaproteobacteria bacterium]|nr:MAG: hypothetical protein CSA49_05625 [Gammaproteobacteria bacterium]